jgi:hypothetical protein
LPPPRLNSSYLKKIGSPIKTSRSYPVTGGVLQKYRWVQKCIPSIKNSNILNNRYANGTKKTLGTFSKKGN